MEYYNTNIQLHKEVINDIFNNFTQTTKFLVFGLGYDSKMWYNGNPNTFFVEDKDEFIDINKNDIPMQNIIKYNYNISIKDSYSMTLSDLEKFIPPHNLIEKGPFDIILIDGPEGYTLQKPGRIIPMYWTSTFLSKPSTKIYVDDSNRPLEKYGINFFFRDKQKHFFKNRNGCTKIIY